jgi:hypothetical protein
MRKDSGTSNPSYDRSATPAVTGITVLGDGTGRPKERLTDENRPLRSKPLNERYRCFDNNHGMPRLAACINGGRKVIGDKTSLGEALTEQHPLLLSAAKWTFRVLPLPVRQAWRDVELRELDWTAKHRNHRWSDRSPYLWSAQL